VAFNGPPIAPLLADPTHAQQRYMAAAAGAVSEAEALSWRETINRAVSLRRYFFSPAQFVVSKP
jgi:hypothetical protein